MPPICRRDVDCYRYCSRTEQGIGLCYNQRSCICLPKLGHLPPIGFTPQLPSPPPPSKNFE
ncbi:hypothetical protein LINGRAHAP2_LOCUS33615 [Linum grandiflorum]